MGRELIWTIFLILNVRNNFVDTLTQYKMFCLIRKCCFSGIQQAQMVKMWIWEKKWIFESQTPDLGPDLDGPRACAGFKKKFLSTYIIIVRIHNIIVYLTRVLSITHTFGCSPLFSPKMAILKDFSHPPGWAKSVQKIQILFFFNKDNIKFFYVYKHTFTP